MKSLSRYSKYRDSGVNWIGEIPNHWKAEKLKYVFNDIQTGTTPPTENKLFFNGTLNWFNPKDLNKIYLISSEQKLSKLALKRKKVKLFKKNSVLIVGIGATTGKTAYLSINATFNQQITGLYSYNYNNKYLFYAIKNFSKIFLNISNYTTLPILNNEFLKSFLLVLPPKEEQIKITNYLDQKTEQIDKAITQKQELIKLLKERQQIVINSAVTKGIDGSVVIKDSGVEWLGDIPKHWEVKKLKYISQIFRGKFTHRPRNDLSLYDGKYPFFQTGDVARAGKFLFKYRQTLNDKGLKVSSLFPKGTIVMTIAANIGDIAILDIDACFPDSIIGFKPFRYIDRDYLYYALFIMKETFINATIKNTQMNLNIDRVGNNFITLPPIEEQNAIIKYIQESSSKIDKAINLKKREIERLKELKETLIDGCVTGRVKIEDS